MAHIEGTNMTMTITDEMVEAARNVLEDDFAWSVPKGRANTEKALSAALEAAMAQAPTPATVASEPVAWIPSDIFNHLTRPKARSGLFEMAATERGDPWHKCTVPLYASTPPASEAVKVKALDITGAKISLQELQAAFGPSMPIAAAIILENASSPSDARMKLNGLLANLHLNPEER